MSISLDQATALVSAAQAIAAADTATMTFAVVDEGGHLITLSRMDGAPWITVEIAIGKAWTAAAWQTPSADQGERARLLPQFAAAISVATHGRHTPQDGGLPIRVEGRTLGGIGASGSTGQHDADVVRRAIDRVFGVTGLTPS
jgi:glc operon protein GlcG